MNKSPPTTVSLELEAAGYYFVAGLAGDSPGNAGTTASAKFGASSHAAAP